MIDRFNQTNNHVSGRPLLKSFAITSSARFLLLVAVMILFQVLATFMIYEEHKRRTLLWAIWIMALLCCAPQSRAVTHYVDNAATGANDGTSWTDAWTDLNNIKGLSPDDLVYISGGTTSKTYQMTSTWNVTGGAPGHPVVYSIGRAEGHNGTAIFNCTNTWIDGGSYFIISGEANDGGMHFQLGIDGGFVHSGNNCRDVRLSYINFGERTGGFNYNPASGVEIDHCYYKKLNNPKVDRMIYLANSSAEWDNSKIHHNTILLPRRLGTGMGDDAIQNAGIGVSIYNNRFIGYTTNYTGGQHQDGIQPLMGNYLKIYNNYFENIGNYPVFCDGYVGDFTHVRVFNNVAVLTDFHIQTNNAPQGIVLGPDGGVMSKLGRWPLFDDIVIANNTIVDYGKHSAVQLNNGTGQYSVFTNCILANNLSVNSGAIGGESTVTMKANIYLNSSEAARILKRYSVLSENGDFHIENPAALLLSGMNLNEFFTFDMDDQTRNDTPTVGAFQYLKSVPSPTGFKMLQFR